MSDKLPRINKYIADLGICSRREAEELINKGWVSVNGEVLKDLSYRVSPKDNIDFSERVQTHLNKKLTIVINKPLGYVSAQAEDDYEPAIRLVNSENYFGKAPAPKVKYKGFAPAGRLDIDSTGLLILTQEGKVAQKIIGPTSKIEKEYVVLVDGEITPAKIKKLCFGLKLDGQNLKRAKVTQEDQQKIRMVLTEGKKRQIRRMCELVDLKVTSLRRVRIGALKLGSLPIGKWRLLNSKEIKNSF